MAWIEIHGERVYVMGKVNGKRICIKCGKNRKRAEKIRDKINAESDARGLRDSLNRMLEEEDK